MKKNVTFGALGVFLSYVMWGFLTIFWNLLTDVNSIYILAHRVAWSMIFMAVYMAVTGGWKEIADIFRDKKKLGICFVSGILITCNWGVYIVAVNGGHVLDASLGYFLEPILVAFIGVLLFKEKMSRLEKVTFAFAAVSLIYMIVVSRTFPVMALLIGATFSAYGAVKKSLQISAQASLFMETFCMTPFALIFIFWMEKQGMGSIGVLHGAQFWLLPACGVVTSIPLLLFNMGIKEIPYYISGILMYVSPTIQFIIGLYYFHEPMDVHRFAAFVLIWAGILFTIYEKINILRKDLLWDHGSSDKKYY